MKSINYTVYRDHLGDENTEEMNTAYIAAVESALEEGWPAAEVSVDLVNGSGYRNGYASGFDDDEAVMEIVNHIANDIWGRGKY